MTARKAAYDVNGILVSHGYVDFPVPAGGKVVDVPDEFNFQPMKWRLVGATHEAVTPSKAETDEASRIAEIKQDAMRQSIVSDINTKSASGLIASVDAAKDLDAVKDLLKKLILAVAPLIKS